MNKEKKMRKLKEKGITLVALVVTIIILLILAGVTLNLALGEGGIFARAKNTADRYQATQANELGQLLELEKELDKYGNGGAGTGGDEGSTNTVTPQPPTPSTGGSAEELSGKLSGDETVVGKTVTGLTGGVADQYTWEIFYADKNNIYLISKDFIKVADCPEKGGAKITQGDTAYEGYWGDTLLGKYAGSTSINEIGKQLNKSYFIDHAEEYTSKNENMKAVAYMLDTNIWKEKIVGTDNNKVEYVVGGPSIELLFKAYNAKKGTDYRAQASSATGYQISKDGKSWLDTSSGWLDSDEKTFILDDGSKAGYYWLSSPCNKGSNWVMAVGDYVYIQGRMYDIKANGFRPVICLASDVEMEKSGDTYKIK